MTKTGCEWGVFVGGLCERLAQGHGRGRSALRLEVEGAKGLDICLDMGVKETERSLEFGAWGTRADDDTPTGMRSVMEPEEVAVGLAQQCSAEERGGQRSGSPGVG